MTTPEWIDKLENQLGFIAVPNLIKGIVILNILTVVLQIADPQFIEALFLIPENVLQGEVRRTITFLTVYPLPDSIIGFLFFLIFLRFTWFIADGLEEAWGDFKITFFLLLSLVALNAVTLLGEMYHPIPIPSYYITFSFFAAFATLYPNLEIMLFPIPIPIQVKWIALFGGAVILFGCLGMPVLLPLAVSSMLGYILFFVPGFLEQWKMRRDSAERMKKFKRDDENDDE